MNVLREIELRIAGWVRWNFPRMALKAGLVSTLVPTLAGCGVFVTQRDYEQLEKRNAALEKQAQEDRANMAQLRADLEATRTRLDNALRANADNGSDLMTSKQRLNEMAGRFDELAHNVDMVKKDVQASRTELDARIDELKRTAASATPPPPPVVIPQDKRAHFAAIEAAHAKKDWGLVRTLGHEYADRYPTDEQTDTALYLIGDGDLQDGKPSSALGEYNRILKQFPRSDVLDKTLLGMGDAYVALHDCTNAKIAYTACDTRFAKTKIGPEIKARLKKLDAPAPGLCAPAL
jgi:TolA-binding protein